MGYSTRASGIRLVGGVTRHGRRVAFVSQGVTRHERVAFVSLVELLDTGERGISPIHDLTFEAGRRHHDRVPRAQEPIRDVGQRFCRARRCLRLRQLTSPKNCTRAYARSEVTPLGRVALKWHHELRARDGSIALEVPQTGSSVNAPGTLDHPPIRKPARQLSKHSIDCSPRNSSGGWRLATATKRERFFGMDPPSPSRAWRRGAGVETTQRRVVRRETTSYGAAGEHRRRFPASLDPLEVNGFTSNLAP